MFFFLFAGAVSVAAYFLNVMALWATRNRYRDGTSLELSAGLQQTARICSAVGLILFTTYTYSLGRYSWLMFGVGLLPLVAQYLALSTALRGETKAPEPSVSDVGFNRL